MAADGLQLPDVKTIFKKLLELPYRGRVIFSHARKMAPEEFRQWTDNQIREWFRLYHKENFLVHEDDSGRAMMYSVYNPHTKICTSYLSEENCENERCRQLHVCKNFIGGSCGGLCFHSHGLNDAHNEQVFRRCNLQELTEEQRRFVVRESHPQICNYYNEGKGTCNHRDRCTRLHLCVDLARGECSEPGEPCPKNLSHVFSSPTTVRQMQMYGLQGLTDAEKIERVIIAKSYDDPAAFLRLLRMLAESPGRTRERRIPELFTDSPTEIKTYSDFATAAEITGASCSVKWQLKIFDEWHTLNPASCYKIEESFCDPNRDDVHITLDDVTGLSGETAGINFKTMKLSLLDYSDETMVECEVQRLPEDEKQEMWLWYFSDGSCWTTYDEVDQQTLESAYKASRRRIHVKRDECRVKFSEMTEKNRRDGIITDVKRRPILIPSK